MSKGTAEYALTKEDVGLRLHFIYVPVNFEGKCICYSLCIMKLMYTVNSNNVVPSFSGQEGESVSIVSQIVKRG